MSNGDALFLRCPQIGVVGEEREHRLVEAGDEAAIDHCSCNQSRHALGHRAEIVSGRRIEIDYTGAAPRLQIIPSEVVLECEAAMAHNNNAVQIGLFPLLEPSHQGTYLCGVETHTLGSSH